MQTERLTVFSDLPISPYGVLLVGLDMLVHTLLTSRFIPITYKKVRVAQGFKDPLPFSPQSLQTVQH